MCKQYDFDDPISVIDKVEKAASAFKADPKRKRVQVSKPALRPKKRRKSSRSWSEDDPVGVKRQRLVKWLMSHPRCVDRDKARLIAARKYPYE